MAKVRIIAHTMHEHERDRALELCDDDSVAHGRLVVGAIDEERVGELIDAGAIVQYVDQPPPVAAVESVHLAPPPVASVARRTPSLTAALEEPTSPAAVDVYVLVLAGPLLPMWRSDLEARGVELLELVEPNHYTVRLALRAVPDVRALPFVVELRLYRPTDTADSATLSAPESVEADGRALFDVVAHRREDVDEVVGWLDTRSDTEIVGRAGRKVRFHAVPGSATLAALARMPVVAAVDEFTPPRLSNDRARILIGLDVAGELPAALTGNGEVVGVADSGIDLSHPDFAGRVKAFALGIPGDPDDHHGHGTHVAGSIAGDGTGSSGALRGAAPAARLVFQSVMDAGGGLGGLPLDLRDLFEQAYQEGARIHNNSWGAMARSAYRVSSLEVDEYVSDHPDFLVVVAAGNAGTAGVRAHSQVGFVDLLSVDAPGTAKNALTVGASRSDRRMQPPVQWKVWWPGDFPDPPIADQEVSGDPETMAAFSGRGPCFDQIRMKPDVVAPGTFILSTRAAGAPDASFWPPPIAGEPYAFMGGTSMATPLVSGMAALVREHLRTERGRAAPSAALLKAVIINGTRWLGGADAIADHGAEPNYHQGFGAVHLPWTLPNPRMPALRLDLVDGPGDPAGVLDDTGDSVQFVVNVRSGTFLRLCLAWTDPPGNGLQNTLHLLLEHSESKRKWVGNGNRRAQLPGPDPGNNVQVIRIDDPAPGSYLVQVSATNLLRPPQAFALVASGDLESPLTPI